MSRCGPLTAHYAPLGALGVAEVASELDRTVQEPPAQLRVASFPGIARRLHRGLELVRQPRLRRLERLSRRVNRLFCLPQVEVGGGKREEGHAAKWISLQLRPPEFQRLGTKRDRLLGPLVAPCRPRF